mmetsp:Transcript_94121/g.304517  ORF Transcript_94121/g.304517 Transcript_94121/m.304517 type:complete len:390 (+) Transcript_94121:373-1542(+)
MHVVLRSIWQLVVHDVVHTRQIQASGGDIRGHEDLDAVLFQVRDRCVPLPLIQPSVDGLGIDLVVAKFPSDFVASALRVREDDGFGDFAVLVRDTLKLVHEKLELAVRVRSAHVLEALLDHGGARADLAHADPHVAGVQEVQSHVLHLLREGRREHHGLPTLPASARYGHVSLLNDLLDLGQETHVQHAVGLIQGQILHVGHADNSARDKVRQPARCCDDDVGTVGELSELRLRVRTSIEASDANLRTEAEAAALLRDLLAQLTRGREHHAGGQNSALLHYLLLCQRLHGSSDDGREEGGRLTASRLRADHDVRAVEGGRDGVFLHGRGDVVTATLEVVDEGLGEVVLLANRCEGLQRLLLSLAADSLDIDILVLPEVEAFRNVLGPEE